MEDKQKYIVTCRFPSWGYGEEKNTYPAFGVKYLVEIPFDKEEIEDEFKKLYAEKIKKEFDGEILFIEEVNFCILWKQ